MRRIGGGPDIRTTPVVIYGLCEPSTMEVRYVGKGADPRARLVAHRSDRGVPRVRDWLRSLGTDPVILPLRVVAPGEDVDAAERAMIEKHRGPRLLNRCLPRARRGVLSDEAKRPRSPLYGVRQTAAGAAMLREFRVDRGISQKSAAKALHVTPTALSHWENGHARPRADHSGNVAVWTGGKVPVSAWSLKEETIEQLPFQPRKGAA